MKESPRLLSKRDGVVTLLFLYLFFVSYSIIIVIFTMPIILLKIRYLSYSRSSDNHINFHIDYHNDNDYHDDNKVDKGL